MNNLDIPVDISDFLNMKVGDVSDEQWEKFQQRLYDFLNSIDNSTSKLLNK